ncbi:hypothetical protein [Adlercreutzia sp. ZJ242]|uniref:hypothetical protein n=1 Tax=Adlercreutzia sp. ZJ242 TaxID=2709409 RepID=UPI0013EB09F5|nr:hypothetical protein [Adlercreutzia sp. ZJ242]
MDALAVERVSVRRGRLSLLVRVAPDAPHLTSPALARAILAERPTLAYHTCVNPFGPTFGDAIACTSLPHVLEHAIIDEQVRHPRSLTDATFVGTTEWLDEAAGLARVEVNFSDDLVALEAMRNALSFVNGKAV